MMFEKFDLLLDSYSERGLPFSEAFTKAVKDCISLKCRLDNIDKPYEHELNKLALDMTKSYYRFREKKQSHEDALSLCAVMVENHIQDYCDGTCRKDEEAVSRRRFEKNFISSSERKFKTDVDSTFRDFDDTANSLPHLRKDFGYSTYEPDYKTEIRTPAGKRPMKSGPHRPDITSLKEDRYRSSYKSTPVSNKVPHYRTEYREPCSQSNHSDASSSHLRAGGPSDGKYYSFTSKHYSSADPPLPFPPYSDTRARSYHTDERKSRDSSQAYDHRSPSPQHYFNTERRSSYASYGRYYARPQAPPQQLIGRKPATCPYHVLHISQSASAQEIKKAYRTLCMKWHPDRCNVIDKEEATEKMAEVNQAYDVLSDEKKREFYDQTGHIPGAGNM